MTPVGCREPRCADGGCWGSGTGAIAKALEDVARKAEQGLARNFSTAHHDVLKATGRKPTQVAGHVAENEAKTAAALAGKDAEQPGAGVPHAPQLGAGGAGGPGGGPRGDEDPSLGGHSDPGQPSDGDGSGPRVHGRA